MGNLSNSTHAPQHLPAFPVTEATGEEKQGWGRSLFPISGKSFLGGFIDVIYMFINITKELQFCVLPEKQKTAVSQSPCFPQTHSPQTKVTGTLPGTRQVNPS